MPVVVLTLDQIPDTMELASGLRWWLTPIPSFCIGQGIVFTSTYKVVSKTSVFSTPSSEPEGSVDIFAIENLTGNYVILLCTAIVFTILLIVIEADILQKCAICRCYKIMASPQENPYLDEDVLAEE